MSAENDFGNCGSGCQPNTQPWPHTMIWGQCANAVQRYQGQRPVIVEEYGQLMSGGGVHMWNLAPDLLDAYPLDRRIEHGKLHGGKVLRRRVIVLDEWEETT
ncbi:hypothetical protein KCMC57_64290 (plasmid) [Kitasatospora sp. CMC57]|uniref:Uncharacterized protein n=1 Tax=Kitasatospora sp. CMC57 TaxID=3231513 RepID=A0AB33K3J0_9ACTN